VDHGAVRSVYFTDPNGIALQASWWVHDPTGQPADRPTTTISLVSPIPIPSPPCANSLLRATF
jgi:hypothetical protein